MLQAFRLNDDVNNPASSSSELLQSKVDLIIIFSYKCFFFHLMQIYILKQIRPLKSAYKLREALNCNVLLTLLS